MKICDFMYVCGNFGKGSVINYVQPDQGTYVHIYKTIIYTNMKYTINNHHQHTVLHNSHNYVTEPNILIVCCTYLAIIACLVTLIRYVVHTVKHLFEFMV